MVQSRNYFYTHSAGEKTESQCHSLKMSQGWTQVREFLIASFETASSGVFYVCFLTAVDRVSVRGLCTLNPVIQPALLSQRAFPFLMEIESKKSSGQPGPPCANIPPALAGILNLQVTSSQVRGRVLLLPGRKGYNHFPVKG